MGLSQHRLQSRICSHMGISYRTNQPLSTKEYSAPRNHSKMCKAPLKFSDFKILTGPSNKTYLPILESLFIKFIQPSLNSNNSSTPLLIAWDKLFTLHSHLFCLTFLNCSCSGRYFFFFSLYNIVPLMFYIYFIYYISIFICILISNFQP